MVRIIFESHATTLDNRDGLASGWFDVELSELGREQAVDLGRRYANDAQIAVIFCSDLQRSFKTAEIAFGNKHPIIRDPRLRECDYGTMTRAPKTEVDAWKERALTTPFPGGESYIDATNRMQSFLSELNAKYADQTVMIIGHRATQYALEHLINDVPLPQAVLSPWHWQPGWKYEL